MAKWIVAEKTKAGLRHAVVCPNVTGRTKKTRLNKASGLVLVRSPMLTSHMWREHVSSGRLVCRCHGVFSLVLRFFLFCFVFCLYHIYAVVEAGARRSIVLRYAGVPIATRVSFLLFIWRCRFFEYFFRFLFVIGEYGVYVLSFRMIFFYLVTTGWIFYISLCENSNNHSRALNLHRDKNS